MNTEQKSEAANQDGSPPSISRDLLDRWRDAEAYLLEWRSKEFPVGSVVRIDCEKYKGTGKVVPSYNCPPDQLAVLLENSNIWWYPLEACSKRSNDRSETPPAGDSRKPEPE